VPVKCTRAPTAPATPSPPPQPPAAKPGLLDLRGKKKWEAWESRKGGWHAAAVHARAAEAAAEATSGGGITLGQLPQLCLSAAGQCVVVPLMARAAAGCAALRCWCDCQASAAPSAAFAPDLRCRVSCCRCLWWMLLRARRHEPRRGHAAVHRVSVCIQGEGAAAELGAVVGPALLPGGAACAPARPRSSQLTLTLLLAAVPAHPHTCRRVVERLVAQYKPELAGAT
jgi:hypothetical protein